MFPIATPARSGRRAGGRAARREPPDIVVDAAFARTVVHTPDEAAVEATARERLAAMDDSDVRRLIKQRDAVAEVRVVRAGDPPCPHPIACVCVAVGDIAED